MLKGAEMAGEKGFIHIYTGDGKGKTTAAFGLALRAAGHGWRVYAGQFMKGRVYGELVALKDISAITVEPFGDEDCLIRRADVTPRHIAGAESGLRRCREALHCGRFEMVILDEVLVAIWFGLLPEEEVRDLLSGRPPGIEIVLTGRYASPSLIEMADVVTEMRSIKHYYERGVTAREGIEC